MESVLEQPAAHMQSSIKTFDQTSLHLLPCGIHHDGRANIPGFFFLVDGQYQSTPAADTTASSATTTTSTTTAATTVISEEVTNGNITISSESTTTAVTTSSTTAVPAAAGSVPPEVSLRGRTLKGTVMTVPEGYIGTIYTSSELTRGGAQGSNGNNHSNAKQEEDMDMDNDDEEYEAMLRGMQEERRVMKTEAQFKEWMFWGHDDQPTARTDKVVRAMQWIDIANVLHEPLLC
ncbi:MAG: ribonuclease H2, subunit C [Linnemannia gamsii]|nr:MAG: ribonuclease H2, subunit C [Linnemannia gamsii]